MITYLSFRTSISSHVWFFSMHYISTSMPCSHTSSSTASSSVRGTSDWGNNTKIENEFGVAASLISHKLLFFSLLDMSSRHRQTVWWSFLSSWCAYWCILGCDFCCRSLCWTMSWSVLGVDSAMTFFLTCGVWTTSSAMSLWSIDDTNSAFFSTVPSHDSFSTNWTSWLMITFLVKRSYNLYDFVSSN